MGEIMESIIIAESYLSLDLFVVTRNEENIKFFGIRCAKLVTWR